VDWEWVLLLVMELVEAMGMVKETKRRVVMVMVMVMD
jgi:hypothetical protein